MTSGAQLADPVQVGVAELRFRRLVAFILGISVLAYFVVDLPVLQAQSGHYPVWWAAATSGALVAAGLGLTVYVWFADERRLRLLLLAYAVFGFVAVATLIPVVGIAGMPESLGAPEILRVKTNFVLAAALALSPRLTWAYAAVVLTLAGVDRWLTSSALDPIVALEDTVITLSVTATLVLFAQAVVAAGRTLDRAAVSAAQAVGRDAADAAAATERRRVELLAHDDILYTLRAASLGLRSDAVTPQSLARETLRRLDELEQVETGEPAPALPIDEFLRRLRSLATEIAPEARFTAEDDPELELPADAATALLEASGEALRNSVRHAGEPHGVHRSLAVRASDAGLAVSISDDGVGFRPRRVPPHRLGVSRSILQRMRSLPGGSATVRSRPGSGTNVDLEWRR